MESKKKIEISTITFYWCAWCHFELDNKKIRELVVRFPLTSIDIVCANCESINILEIR